MENLFLYFLLLTIVAFVIMRYDKQLAIKGRFRISERTLFLIALCGGSAGMMLGMIVFRHKISKTSFILKFALIVLLQSALLYGIVNNVLP